MSELHFNQFASDYQIYLPLEGSQTGPFYEDFEEAFWALLTHVQKTYNDGLGLVLGPSVPGWEG